MPNGIVDGYALWRSDKLKQIEPGVPRRVRKPSVQSRLRLRLRIRIVVQECGQCAILHPAAALKKGIAV